MSRNYVRGTKLPVHLTLRPELEEHHKETGVSLGRLSVSSEAADRFRKLGKG